MLAVSRRTGSRVKPQIFERHPRNLAPYGFAGEPYVSLTLSAPDGQAATVLRT